MASFCLICAKRYSRLLITGEKSDDGVGEGARDDTGETERVELKDGDKGIADIVKMKTTNREEVSYRKLTFGCPYLNDVAPITSRIFVIRSPERGPRKQSRRTTKKTNSCVRDARLMHGMKDKTQGSNTRGPDSLWRSSRATPFNDTYVSARLTPLACIFMLRKVTFHLLTVDRAYYRIAQAGVACIGYQASKR